MFTNIEQFYQALISTNEPNTRAKISFRMGDNVYLNAKTWSRLNDWAKNQKYPSKTETFELRLFGTNRITGGNVYTKTHLYRSEDKNYGLIFKIDRLIKTKPLMPTRFKDVIKTETLYTLPNAQLSFVETKFGRDISYTLSLQPQTKRTTVAEITNICKLVISIILETDIPYPYGKRNEVISRFNSLLNVRSDVITLAAMVQPRNLKFDDIVAGGIVGNSDTDYVVSYKADGVRRFLYITDEAIWLLGVGNYCNLLMVNNSDISGLVDLCKNWSGTIFDGELVPITKQQKQPGIANLYVAFDTVYSTRLAERDYISRFNLLNRFVAESSSVSGLSFTFLPKDYSNLTKIDRIGSPSTYSGYPPYQHFFNTIKRYLEEENRQVYKTDGLIFTPTNVPYGPLNLGVPLKERVLTKLPDVCKWKPPEKLTVDLLVNANKTLAAYSEKNKRLQIFDIPRENVAWKLINQKDYGKIIEFSWKAHKIDDTQRLILTPERVRNDKRSPNSLETAIELSRMVEKPITAETLLGTDFRLVRKAFNRVKSKLFGGLKPSDRLLDIGSGRGADIEKWPDNVVAVEPDPENRKILEQRLVGNRRKVTVLGSKAQDLNPSQLGLFDAVAFMLSLSHFANEDISKLGLLITKVLKPNGSLLLFTIDGDAVQETFSPQFNPALSLNAFELGIVKLSLTGERLEIVFPNTILTNYEEDGERGRQTENLFHFLTLLKELPSFKVTDIKRPSELLLDYNSYRFSQLYMYAKLIREYTEKPIEFGTSGRSARPKLKSEPLNITIPVINIEGLGPLYAIKCSNLLDAILTSFSETYNLASREQKLRLIREFAVELGNSAPTPEQFRENNLEPRDLIKTFTSLQIEPDDVAAIGTITDILDLGIFIVIRDGTIIGFASSPEGRSCLLIYDEDTYYVAAERMGNKFKTIYESKTGTDPVETILGAAAARGTEEP